ncbi:MAG: Flp pilus assembly protein CpaB [Actinomycetota bacterium]|nr:Flp pilus assembly protein CpaB [Actinomycetota bacterium]
MGRRAIVLLVALILAGLAAWAVWNYLQSVEDDITEGQRIVTVYRAGPDGIAEGAEGDILLSAFSADARCQDEDLGFADAGGCTVKKGTDQFEDVPADALDSEDKLRNVLSGKVAAGPVSAGSILTAAQWTEITVDVIPLSEQIPSGKQALTISTSNVQGVNGFVEAGDRINMIISLDIEFDLLPVDFGGITLPSDTTPGDELGTTDPAAEDTQAVTVTYTRYVLQGLPVLAAGRNIRPDEDDETVQVPTTDPAAAEAEGEDVGNSTVFTLEVTPDQAERIVFAFQNGSIWLTLVPTDFVEVETDGVVIDNLFGGDLIEEIFGNLEPSN